MAVQNSTEDIFPLCDQFRKGLNKALDIVKKNSKKIVIDFRSSMGKERKETSQLSAFEDNLQSRIIETTKHCSSHEDQIVNLEKLYTNLQREKQILPVTLENIEEKVRDAERELELCRNEISALEDEYRFKQDVICREIDKYKKYMGVDVQIEDRLLKIVIDVNEKTGCIYFEIGGKNVLKFIRIEPTEYIDRLTMGEEVSVSKLVKEVVEYLME